MQIRTRVSILSVLVTLIVGAGIVFAAIQREDLIGKRYSNQIIADQLILWNKIKDGLISDMRDLTWVFLNDGELISALESRDSVELQRIGSRINKQFEDEPAVDRVELVFSDGTLGYSSQSAVFQSAIISNSAISQAIEDEEPISGVGNDKQRNTSLVYGIPIFGDDDDVLGVGILARSIEGALAEMEEVNFASVVIVNRRGRLLASTGENLWDRYSDLIDISEANVLHTIEDDGRYFSVIVLPQIADLGGLVGRLLNIREVTGLVQQQQRISRNTAIVIVLFLVLAIVGLYLYLLHSFTPLTDGVSVLSALSKGDLQVQIERDTGKDEVGLIANAVNVFRSNLLTLDRFRRSRERQQGRQQRFIFREMKGLADTLDGEEREELLKELQHLDEIVEGEASVKSDTFAGLSDDTTAASRRRDSDSLAMLAVAFQGMSGRVRDQHQRLRDALATKEALIALRNELNIATRVQQSLLPANDETEQVANKFKIWGGMWPAKEVGGDFYDFFQLDEERLAIAIADVSGKGVPAALFTVMSRTMLHATGSYLSSPGGALMAINNFLEQNNDEGLFVTVFYGILNLKTGNLAYASGGHNSPIVSDSRGTRPLEQAKGMVLAMFRDIELWDGSIDLEPGSRLILFTDGIPEAFNAQGEAYGDDRLIEVVQTLPDQSPEADVNMIVNAVNDFVQDAPQFDDIACVSLHYLGEQAETMEEAVIEIAKLSLVVKHDLAELARIADDIEAHAQEHDWPTAWVPAVNLSLDELITNIVNYGFANQPEKKDIDLTLKVIDDNLYVELIDEGVAFDPFTDAPQPSLDAPIEEREIGGLGIYFVKSLVNQTRYERKEGKNYTTLILYPPE